MADELPPNMSSSGCPRCGSCLDTVPGNAPCGSISCPSCNTRLAFLRRFGATWFLDRNACEHEFSRGVKRLDPLVVLMDMGRWQWVGAHPFSALEEAQTNAMFECDEIGDVYGAILALHPVEPSALVWARIGEEAAFFLVPLRILRRPSEKEK